MARKNPTTESLEIYYLPPTPASPAVSASPKQDYSPSVSQDEVKGLVSSVLSNNTGLQRIQSGAIQSGDYIANESGWALKSSGGLEASTGFFRGSITGAKGQFTGSVKVGTTSYVLIDGSGLQGISYTLGQTFLIPTNGDKPMFSNGVIEVSEINTPNISGGQIFGTVITGSTLQTAYSGRRLTIDSQGIRLIAGNLGITYGDNSKLYGDNSRLYGTGVVAYINNDTYKIPFYVSTEQTVADLHLFNRSGNPSGTAEIGDIAVVSGVPKICTAPGTPGTWVALVLATDTTLQAFKVGSIYTNITGTNPATELGYGTWSAWGSGQAPVGYKNGDSDFGTVEGTGGAKTVSIAHTHTGPSHTHGGATGTPSATLSALFGATAGSDYGNGTHTHSVGADGSGNTGSMSANATPTILQPFIVCYFWKRTA